MTQTPSFFEDLMRAGIPIAIAGAAIAGYFIWGSPGKVGTAAPPAAAAADVITASAVAFSDPIQIVVDGVAQPHRHVSLAAEVSGRVKYKNPACNDGKFVKAGTMLYEIDPADYESTVKRIQEELLQADNALKEWEVDRNNALGQIELSEQELVLAQRETERLKSLRENNATSTADLEQAMRSEVAARLSLQGMKNQVRALDARKSRAESMKELQQIALVQAQRNLERTKIFAPVDSIIVTDDCEEGSYVTSGKVVAVINDVSKAEVGCQLELQDLYWLWEARAPGSAGDTQVDESGAVYDFPPMPVTIEFPFSDRLCRWTGTISRFGGTGIDLSTRTIPCRVLVEDPGHSSVFDMSGAPVNDIVPPPLSTGMFVSVRIPVVPRVPLIEVPVTAVRSGGVVWLFRDGKLKIQNVKIARRTKDRVLLHVESDGIRANDRVVVSPLAVAVDGMDLKE